MLSWPGNNTIFRNNLAMFRYELCFGYTLFHLKTACEHDMDNSVRFHKSHTLFMNKLEFRFKCIKCKYFKNNSMFRNIVLQSLIHFRLYFVG